MRTPARLSLYGLVLIVVFAVAAVTARAVVPRSTVESWTREAATASHHGASTNHGAPSNHGSAAVADRTASQDGLGLSLAQSGYRLTDVGAPTATGARGTLRLTVTGPDERPVTDFAVNHEKRLHLIVVRADGSHFRHVHPTLDGRGVWTIPWAWQAAGSYRVYADFVPKATGDGITLSTNVQVTGRDEPAPATRPTTSATTGGYTVTAAGRLVAGQPSTLRFTLTRGGAPVTDVQPYLGAFGHLVALRQGDLAYLHAHPDGAAPAANATGGPTLTFETTAPTPGRYLLYLDVRVGDRVRTFPLVLDAATDPAGDTHTSTSTPTSPEEGAGHDH